MEKYSMSSLSKKPVLSSKSNETASNYNCSREESGWTEYFEDFFTTISNENDLMSCSSNFDYECSSLVSDAASKMFTHKDQVSGWGLDRPCERLSFKKRKTKAALFDDDLEDTASSPVNSPKVCNMMERLDQNPLRKDILGINAQEKGSTSRLGDGEREMGFHGRGRDCTELKKRGLCLVPLSMVVNYLN